MRAVFYWVNVGWTLCDAASHSLTYIVIVIAKFIKPHSKAKHRAPAYSRALRRIRWVVHRVRGVFTGFTGSLFEINALL